MCNCSDAVDDAKTKPEDKIDQVEVECPKATLTVKVVAKNSGDKISNVTVTVGGEPAQQTKKNGKAIFKIEAGHYKISVRKDGFDPDPVETEVTLADKEKLTKTLELTPLEVHLHVDANRDGKVDDDWTNNDKWEAGAAGKFGAIILCNNDDEDSDKNEDNKNQLIDGADDLNDIALIAIRKKPDHIVFPKEWYLELSVDDPDIEKYVRIFDKHANGGKEVIGPNKGKVYKIDDMNAAEIKLGIEALSYPNKSFDGLVKITLTIKHDSGAELHKEKAQMRVAPWIMFNHANVTEKAYVVDTSDNGTFRSKLKTAMGATPLQEADRATYGDDRWLQDAMEPGFSAMPNTLSKDKWPVPATLRTANDRKKMNWGDIDKFPKDVLLKPNYGFLQAMPPTKHGSSLDSFGNLECSPPFTHSVTNKEYKFGRMVFGGGGRLMKKQVIDLLNAQVVQAPFWVNTDWLIVGHVDEIFSFLPMPDGTFRVLIASTSEAMKIVNATKDSAKLLDGIHLNGVTQTKIDTDYPFKTVKDIKGDAAFKIVQTFVQTQIDGIKTTLKKELDLKDSDFVHLPVLFKEQGGRYVAYTPGVVNMLVITKAAGKVKLCIPKPFGPMDSKCMFEKDISIKLNAVGLATTDFEFIDDFTTYHMLMGEIHCGTNSQRTPSNENWWELTWI